MAGCIIGPISRQCLLTGAGKTLVTSRFEVSVALDLPDVLAFWLRAAACRAETLAISAE